MSLIHICNTFFERELETPNIKPLENWIRSHPLTLQLQFLPLLYAEPEDRILVSDLPEISDPRLFLIQDAFTHDAKGVISDWGPSLSIQNWCQKKNFFYSAPSPQTVKEVNSKIFSFQESPRLPGSSLLQNEKEALSWIQKTAGPKVLKTAFGSAGSGHFHIGKSPNLSSFLNRQFSKGLSVLAEPWVERLFDFSTQWKDGVLLGATVFENDSKGTYQTTLAGPAERIFGSFLWALDEHLAIAAPLVEKMKKIGFFGHFGIDAYVYQSDRLRLQPIVEINGRKTMSWAALQIQQKKFPRSALRFHFSHSDKGLLPSSVRLRGKEIYFSRNISLEKF
jgi:hypothetical protein